MNWCTRAFKNGIDVGIMIEAGYSLPDDSQNYLLKYIIA